jgi:hypothetical protein
MTQVTQIAQMKRRPPVAVRRLGYVIAVTVNAAMLYVVNVWPSWHEVPFLTPQTVDVLGIVNVSIVVGVVANVVYLAYDPRWLRSVGEIVTTGFGLAALMRVWQVFPFDFSGQSFDWAVLTRWVLGVAIFGSVVGIIVQLATLVRLAGGGRVDDGHRWGE